MLAEVSSLSRPEKQSNERERMFNDKDFDSILNATVFDCDGEKVGKVGQLYLDDQTGRPNWVTVNTGLFGMSESFVPLDDTMTLNGDRIEVPYEKALIKDAPRIDADGHIAPEQEQQLYSYYQRSYDVTHGDRDTAVLGADVGDNDLRDNERRDADLRDDVHADSATLGADRRGDVHTDLTDTASLTASEERLNVGTEEHEAGRVRLRTYTTTEQETVTVPVEKEVLSVERESVDSVREGTLDDHHDTDEEIVLREERPVVSKEVHDVERVNVGKETVTEQQQVTGEVAKEHIEVEGDADRIRDGR